ncbi:MAG: glycosyltransferase family 2 protein [Bacteroides sp.]|nr:glycosyltransferase family 2 protein [Bacteroides sp.]
MISVIIPAYNVQDYIAECLDSILNQTYKDLEIIVVDDGSTDSTPQILEEYAKKYPQIRILTQQNSGQSSARNNGLREAEGEEIIFVDSDDWIASETTIEKFHHALSRSESDYVQGGLCFIKGDKITKNYIPGHSQPLSDDEILDAALSMNGLYTAPFAKIYRTEFLRSNSLYFIEGMVNEDTAHSIMIAAFAHKVSFISELTYYSREREGSTSRADFKRMFRTMHEVMNRTRLELRNLGKYSDVQGVFEARYLRSMLYNLLQSAQRLDYHQFKDDWEYCMTQTDYKKNRKYAKSLPVPHKAMYKLSMSPKSFYLSFRLLNKLGIKMH